MCVPERKRNPRQKEKSNEKILPRIGFKPEHPPDALPLPDRKAHRHHGDSRLRTALQGQQDRRVPDHRTEEEQHRSDRGLGGHRRRRETAGCLRGLPDLLLQEGSPPAGEAGKR